MIYKGAQNKKIKIFYCKIPEIVPDGIYIVKKNFYLEISSKNF